MAANVLIVDDSEVMREILRETVSQEFTVVAEAKDGEGAIRAVMECPVDVVLMDMVMPNIDGVEATAAIKQHEPDISIVFCTSVTQQDRMKDAIDAGADGYIMKPFDESTIIQAIHEVM